MFLGTPCALTKGPVIHQSRACWLLLADAEVDGCPLEKLKMELPLTQRSRLGKYLKKPQTLSTAALSTTARVYATHCPSKDEWVTKPWCMYRMECTTQPPKECNLTTVTACLGLEGVVLSEVSQRETNAM